MTLNFYANSVFVCEKEFRFSAPRPLSSSKCMSRLQRFNQAHFSLYLSSKECLGPLLYPFLIPGFIGDNLIESFICRCRVSEHYED